MRNILIGTAICLIGLCGCKKSGGSTPTNNQPPYIGKWAVENEVIWHTTSGTLYKDTIVGKPGEYIDFKADGTLNEAFYQNGEFSYFTFNYEVINGILYCNDFPNNSKIIVSGNRLTIDASDNTNIESIWRHYKK